jgi:hypothetical protein
MNSSRSFVLALLLPSVLACSREEPKPTVPGTPEAPAAVAAKGGHHATIALGEGVAGPFRVEASRDEGEVVAGGEVPIDVWVRDAAGKPGKVDAVRFWIGAADGTGSVKARAEIEDKDEPERFHTHAEAPDPLAADARLHVEIEAGGVAHVASFDLRRG